MSEQKFKISDMVKINLPRMDTGGLIIGILTRIDHILYEVLWADTATTFHSETELKEYSNFD